jgi:hypothetical protein
MVCIVEIIASLPGIKLRILGRSVRSLVTIPTELSQFAIMKLSVLILQLSFLPNKHYTQLFP